MKTNKFEEFYEIHSNLEAAFEEATAEKDEKRIEACKKCYQILIERVRSHGQAFGDIMQDYIDSRKKGNDLLDFRNLNDEDRVPEIVSELRRNGIEEFTFSSRWSSSVEVAWAFQQAGCTLSGMKVVCTDTGNVFVKPEHSPAFLFRV